MTIRWSAAGATHVGRRRRGNEDNYHVDVERGIFLVADGMGGHAAGEVASELAATTTVEALVRAHDEGTSGQRLFEVFERAGRDARDAIVQCCDGEASYRGMGTTLTACVLEESGDVWVGHIGDSRLYRLRDETLEQLTHDHTWVQREIDTGRLTPRAARSHALSHMLTRVLSEGSEPELDVLSETARPGDLLLLATDGLYNMVNDRAITALLAADTPLPATATALIRAANRAGGADNITVVLVRVE